MLFIAWFTVFPAAELMADAKEATSFFDVVPLNVLENALKGHGEFRVEESAGETHAYLFDLVFPKRRMDQHYVVAIEAAPGGTLLGEPNGDLTPPTAEAAAPTALPRPDTMAHFQEHFWGAGPGGAARGVTFTTADRRFDVRITVSENLPQGVSFASVDVYRLAEDIAAEYCSVAHCG